MSKSSLSSKVSRCALVRHALEHRRCCSWGSAASQPWHAHRSIYIIYYYYRLHDRSIHPCLPPLFDRSGLLCGRRPQQQLEAAARHAPGKYRKGACQMFMTLSSKYHACDCKVKNISWLYNTWLHYIIYNMDPSWLYIDRLKSHVCNIHNMTWHDMTWALKHFPCSHVVFAAHQVLLNFLMAASAVLCISRINSWISGRRYTFATDSTGVPGPQLQ